MKIGFGNYTYFDPNAEDKQTYDTATASQRQKYGFSQEHFNQLIANRQYNDAADYAAQYHFSDPKTQREHENDIINLRHNGRVLGAIYSRIDDPNKLAQIEFYDKVFVDGGLEQLSGNNYVDKFAEYKRQLGSKIEHNSFGEDEIIEEATGLEITFQPKTKKFLGIDFLAPDNYNTIDNFYNTSGITEQELKANDVEIINKDGKTTLRFDKSNALANKIIYSVYKPGGSQPAMFGNNDRTNINGINKHGNLISTNNIDLALNRTIYDNTVRIQNIIKDAKLAKEDYFKKTALAEKDYSSTIGPAIDDTFEQLKAARMANEIDETTFRRELNIRCGNLIDAITSFGSERYEMYTNAYNEALTDETMISAGNKERAHLVNLISQTDPKDLQVLSMCSNGKIGALIRINAQPISSKKRENLDQTAKPEDQYSTRRIEIFIPGFMQKQAQAKINGNTSSRSVQEANAMLDWNYTYTCADGTEIMPNGTGGFMKNKENCSEEEAIKAINKDMIIQDAVSNLKYNYITWNGNLISDKDNSMLGAEQYEAMARLIAVRAGNELSPNIPLLKSDGKEYTVDELFNMKGLSNSIYWYNELNGEISRNLPYQTSYKIKDIYSIYDAIMKELRYYNIDPDFKIKK